MVVEPKFKLILDNLITAIIVLEADLTIDSMNASAEMLLGVSGEQMQGRAIEACFSESDGAFVSLHQALEENRNYTKRRATWTLHNHEEIIVDYSVTPSPEMGKIMLEIQPLDRLIRISREEAMMSTQETSRNFIRSMAHEIKNPLGGIRGAAQLLSKELENYDLLEYTNIIIHETDRLRNLVDRMLGPRKPTQFAYLNIHEALEHVAAVVKIEAGSDIRLTRDYDPSIPSVMGDREQLIQAFLNIARNAMQALQENTNRSDEQSKIIFSTRVQRRYTIGRTHYPLVARIAIKDNGPGIPPEIIENIFFPMITGRPEGTGLGLSIAQNLINQHNGFIECESKPGSTEFVIYLPLGQNNA